VFIIELTRPNPAKQSKEEKYKTPHNTDNKGKLFVTVFAFTSATKTNL